MDHPYGWLSLLPPVAAIVLAIVTRRAVFSLIVGVFVGALITTGGNPLRAAYDTAEVHLWATFVEPGKLRVFSFTLLMGAMIGVICRNGGMQGFIRLIAPLAKTRRGGQLTTWLLGMLIFFDDYANTMLLGGALRPVCDRLKISREKLAYLVDSTAAPVAGLSLLSTWVAIEIEYVEDGLQMLGDTGLKPFDLFFASIPYRFYILLSLVLVPLLALTQRDFGPMLHAERKRLREPLSQRLQKAGVQVADDVPGRWPNAVLPIVGTLSTVVWLLYTTGRQNLATPEAGLAEPSLRDILGAADSTYALQYGALVGLLLAAGLSWTQRLLSWEKIAAAAGEGAKVVLPAIAILLAASALSRMTSNRSVAGEPSVVDGVETYEHRDTRLYTGDYLKQIITGRDPNAVDAPANATPVDQLGAGDYASSRLVKFLPALVFLLSAVVAFCTGTSFGTMGILMPMVVSLTYTLLASGGDVSTGHPILLASIGSVLAGAVFGDHCSPISDTTILSSQSCSCDHIAHVVTQMPYALTVAAVSVLFGALPLGWGASVWLLLPVQCAVLAVVVFLFGRKAEADETSLTAPNA